MQPSLTLAIAVTVKLFMPRDRPHSIGPSPPPPTALSKPPSTAASAQPPSGQLFSLLPQPTAAAPAATTISICFVRLMFSSLLVCSSIDWLEVSAPGALRGVRFDLLL